MGETRPERHFVVGGYPAAPSWSGDHQGLIRFANQLLSWRGPRGRSIGLEVPYTPSSPWAEPSVLVSTPPTSRHVLTMIPATMTELRTREGYGLASRDEEGRRSAVDHVRRALEFVHTVNTGTGGKVTAIELQSAPRDPFVSSEAFRQSLQELALPDLGDVALWVEHSDARIPGQDHEKGFLALEAEIGVASSEGLGVLINWGRSAIELRDPERVAEHVETAADAGLLRGLIFSGVASAATEYGHPWVDAHLPVKDSLDGEDAEVFESSLLTREYVGRALRAADVASLDCVGIKMGMPPGTNDQTRLAMLQANVELIADLVDDATSQATERGVTTRP
ncbi:MAG: DUF4862 family protein [Acidimicrobiia bacterium]